jgi:hypothetical protein
VAVRCWGLTVDDMVLRSPAGMKSALGENPNACSASGGSTRPAASAPPPRLDPRWWTRPPTWQKKKIKDFPTLRPNGPGRLLARGDDPRRLPDKTGGARDLKLEALGRVLRREIPWQHADLVIWSGDPFDVMSRAEVAYIGGREVYRYDSASRSGVFASP